jgi:hypothetical protein
MGAASGLMTLFWNGNELSFTLDTVTREWTSTLTYTRPTVSLPVLQDFGVSDPPLFQIPKPCLSKSYYPHLTYAKLSSGNTSTTSPNCNQLTTTAFGLQQS